jgi:hypothetical protein
MMVKEGDRVGTPYPKLHQLHKATAGVPAAEDVLCCTQVSSTVIRPIVLSSSSDSSICFSIKGLGFRLEPLIELQNEIWIVIIGYDS